MAGLSACTRAIIGIAFGPDKGKRLGGAQALLPLGLVLLFKKPGSPSCARPCRQARTPLAANPWQMAQSRSVATACKKVNSQLLGASQPGFARGPVVGDQRGWRAALRGRDAFLMASSNAAHFFGGCWPWNLGTWARQSCRPIAAGRGGSSASLAQLSHSRTISACTVDFVGHRGSLHEALMAGSVESCEGRASSISEALDTASKWNTMRSRLTLRLADQRAGLLNMAQNLC